MVNRKTGTFSMEVKKSVDKGVRDPAASDANAQSAQIGPLFFSAMASKAALSGEKSTQPRGCYTWHSDVQS